MYFAIGQRLEVKENEEPEAVYRRLDQELSVARWLTPVSAVHPVVEREPGAPDWWMDDEDASQTFLKSQGVVFSG